MLTKFTIVATVADQHEGERSFTAEELESTLRDALHDLHLKMVGISVVHSASTPPIPGSGTVGRLQPLPTVDDEVIG